MKTETEPMAFGFLAGAVVLLLGLYASACNPPHYPRESKTRDLAAQYASAVQITETCLDMAAGTMGGAYGSGVLVDGHTVITAGHVATPPEGQLCSWVGETESGSKFKLTPQYVNKDDDVASMKTDHLISGVPPVEYAVAPPLGTEICQVTAYPDHVHRCGEVQPRYKEYSQYLVSDMLVDHGNSGSGVYDEDGRLIGVSVRLTMCGNGQYCGSMVAPLAAHLELLLA